ncbi:hypothetical protein PR048_030209 [Dryococelus australis]|uniref:Uncharacterized protein n=1 Tax=Dryococelus australis TaxID=614101 RepID=A0ABQ9G8B4_9NEOP|nr:hypothetical protein PR048_030209 [Dryococelus australis]
MTFVSLQKAFRNLGIIIYSRIYDSSSRLMPVVLPDELSQFPDQHRETLCTPLHNWERVIPPPAPPVPPARAGMHQDLQEYVQQCELCAQVKHGQAAKSSSTPR